MNGRNAGFTLVEILFAMATGLILLGAIYSVSVSGYKSSAGIERKIAAQTELRTALEIMTLEISMASCNPNSQDGMWLNPSCGASPPANQTYKGIQEATAGALTIEMDINDSSVVGDNPGEIIRYSYDGANEYILRDVNCQGAQAFLGEDPAAGQPRTLRVINAALGINNGMGVPAIFRYYDGRSPAAEVYPGANANDILNIRRIDITLAVETDEVDPNLGQRRRMIYSTSVIPRNHAFGP